MTNRDPFQILRKCHTKTDNMGGPTCADCRWTWPCPQVAALDQAEAELEGHRENADTLAAMTATLTEYGHKMHDLLDERDRLLERIEVQAQNSKALTDLAEQHRAERDRLREALERIVAEGVGVWYGEHMRDIARAALSPENQETE